MINLSANGELQAKAEQDEDGCERGPRRARAARLPIWQPSSVDIKGLSNLSVSVPTVRPREMGQRPRGASTGCRAGSCHAVPSTPGGWVSGRGGCGGGSCHDVCPTPSTPGGWVSAHGGPTQGCGGQGATLTSVPRVYPSYVQSRGCRGPDDCPLLHLSHWGTRVRMLSHRSGDTGWLAWRGSATNQLPEGWPLSQPVLGPQGA